MIRFIILLALGYLLYRVIKPASKGSGEIQASPENDKAALGVYDEMVKDPICQTFVPRREAVSLHQGDQIHYFCSTACRDRFVQKGQNPTAGDT